MELKLGKYKGIAVAKEPFNAEEYEPEYYFKKATIDRGDYVRVSRPANMGDRATIDFTGYIDGKTFEGGSAERYAIVIGSHTFIPGFEEQMVGKKAGEKFDVNLVFPKEYPAAQIAGKSVVFKVLIRYLEEVTPVEYNEANIERFFKCSSKEQFVEEVIKPEAEKKMEEIEDNWADNVLKELIDGSLFIPDEDAVQRGMDRIYNWQMETSGEQFDTHLSALKMTRESFREALRDEATMELKVSAVVEEIAKLENIVVTDEEFEAELKVAAEGYNQPVDVVKEQIGEEIKGSLLTEKVFQVIISNATVKQ